MVLSLSWKAECSGELFKKNSNCFKDSQQMPQLVERGSDVKWAMYIVSKYLRYLSITQWKIALI